MIKEQLKDPLMCECVKNMVDDMVDVIWPDIEDEIMFNLRLNMSQPVLEEYPKPVYSWWCCCCQNFRACFRYNYYPVDKSIWGQFRNFWYWVILLIQMIPFFAVQPLFKLFIWIMIDKSDEYQLIQFILDFKTLMFFTLGGIGGIVGYVNYVLCISVIEGREKSGSEISSCAVQGQLDDLFYILEVS